MKLTRLVICCSIVLLGGLLFEWTQLPGPSFLRTYRQLRIGMPRSEVQTLFGSEPDYHFRFGHSEIWYYAHRGRFTGKFAVRTPEAGSLYRDVTKLPDVYDHVQIAFDENGNLAAYTWIGEAYTVEFLGGSVRGTHFKLLPPGVL